jgi:hypothetical protein
MKVLNSMQVMNGRAEGDDTVRSLILNQRTTAPGHDASILFQQTCLGLANDQSQIVMRRYFEHYAPARAQWVEYIHSIPTAEFIQWIMTHGQLRIECSENTPQTQARA